MSSPAIARENRSRLFPLLLVLAAIAELSLGGYAFACCMTELAKPNCFASAGILLIVSALVQLRIAREVHVHAASFQRWHFRSFGRWQFVGACGSFGVGVAIGPRAGVGCAFAACLAVWNSIVLLPLAAPQQVLDRWRKLIQQCAPRRVGLAVYHTLIVLTLAEATLRGQRQLETLQPFSVAAAGENRSRDGQPATQPALRPGVLRVAVVEGLTTKSPSHSSFCVDGVALMTAGFQIQRVQMGADGDGQPRNHWRAELQAFEPDLVLGLVAIEEGLSPTTEPCGVFNWRSLATVKSIQNLLGRPAEVEVLASPITIGAANYFGEPRAGASGRLAICHTPLDQRMKVRWNKTFAQLDAFIAECEPLETQLALVVVPAGFQVNRVLCDVLRRRAGYEPPELDLALPQRRLAAYAEQRQLALLDLLPYLQASKNPVYRCGEEGWNQEGKSVAGQAISGWLRAQYSGMIATAQLSGGD